MFGAYPEQKPKETTVINNIAFSRYFLSLALALALCLSGGLGVSMAQDNKVLAKVGNETITEADLAAVAASMGEQFGGLNLTPEARKEILEHLVNIFAVAAQAEQEGMDKDPSVKKLLDFTRKDLLAHLYRNKVAKGLPEPSEAEAKAFYDKNQSQYSILGSAHLHHILVKDEKDAKEVLKRLKKGDKFADVAAQVSLCDSKLKGGDLEWKPKGTHVKEIDDVTYSMAIGEIAGPVQSKFGWHILYLQDRIQPQEVPFEQVKLDIQRQLKFQKQQEQYEKLAESVRKKLNAQILEVSEAPKPAAGPTAVPQPPAGPTAAPK
jgi:peptidyl-prolyl cis-trans isomerase C